ncbi:MAG TPA: DmsE family decaheme c-type cytochrome [Terriglobales bacterium]|nr:DmsE family decaheme c-type cytochrome [Terriglobales bacterium]
MQTSEARRTHWLNWIGVVALLFLFGMQAVIVAQEAKAKPAATPASPAAQYVGADTCKTCHEDVFNHMQQTPHYKMKYLGKAETGQPGVGVDCEACHGPGSAHVEGGGDVTKIINFKKLSTAQASERCLSCHASGKAQQHFAQSVHATNDVGCLSCHSVHHAAEPRKLLVKNSQLDLCYSCHTTQKAQFSMPFRHRINEGLLTCTDCHNPHGTTIPRQLETSAGDQQVCYKCHTDKQGPFVFEHVPVRTEGCTSCHMPHGSSNPRMLRVSQVNLLCLQCHTVTANNNIPGIPSFHNQAQKYQACTLCHTRIHGSNFNEFFFK